MIPIDVLGVFFIASVVLGLVPGPDNIFVLTQSALYGQVAGVMVTLGLCTGLLVHTCAVAVGASAIFQASALAFTLLKILGVGYLLYLAWQAFRAGCSDFTMRGAGQLNLRHLYRRGIIMNITNPKVAIFFLAFLPQFSDPTRGSLTLQILSLGAVFMLSTLLVFGAVALGGGTLGEWMKRSDKAQSLLNRAAAIVFVALAAKLLTTQQ